MLYEGRQIDVIGGDVISYYCIGLDFWHFALESESFLQTQILNQLFRLLVQVLKLKLVLVVASIFISLVFL